MHYIGENIKRYRKIKGFTIKELAEKSRTGVSTISQIETGKRDLTFKVLLALSEALQTDISILVVPPSKNTFQHRIAIKVLLENHMILFGSSISNSQQTVSWGIISDLSIENSIEHLYFKSNDDTLTSIDFYKEHIKNYLMEQKSRIKLWKGLNFTGSLTQIKQNGVMWSDFLKTLSFLQNESFNELITKKTPT